MNPHWNAHDPSLVKQRSPLTSLPDPRPVPLSPLKTSPIPWEIPTRPHGTGDHPPFHQQILLFLTCMVVLGTGLHSWSSEFEQSSSESPVPWPHRHYSHCVNIHTCRWYRVTCTLTREERKLSCVHFFPPPDCNHHYQISFPFSFSVLWVGQVPSVL